MSPKNMEMTTNLEVLGKGPLHGWLAGPGEREPCEMPPRRVGAGGDTGRKCPVLTEYRVTAFGAGCRLFLFFHG